MKNVSHSSGVKTTKTHAAVTEEGSMLAKYQNVMVGQRSLGATLYYEWCAWMGLIPGAIGLFLRRLFWPRLFGSCGKGVTFGANVILRHPNRIYIADNVVISDGCILDARNGAAEKVIVLEKEVILSNDVMISCKNGTVRIGAYSGIGAQTIIHSAHNCSVCIGCDVVIGPRCYLVGGGNYKTDRLDIPIWRQGNNPDSGVILENDIWLSANVTVLGGVTIETGSIIAAGAVVTMSMPAMSVCGGVPAKVIKMREKGTVRDTHQIN